MTSKNFKEFIGKVNEKLDERLKKLERGKTLKFGIKEAIGFIPGIGTLIKDVIDEVGSNKSEKILNEFKALSEKDLKEISEELGVSARNLNFIKNILLDELPDILDLCDFCKIQVKNGMDHLKASSKDELREKKYSSELYVRRDDIESNFFDFLNREKNPDKNCFAVIGEAGIGKTNLFCQLADDMVEKCPTLFYNGLYLTDEIENHIMGDIGLHFGIQRDFSSIIIELNSLVSTNSKYFIIFIDAVNESQNYRKLRINIANLLNQLAMAKADNIKFCISCRDIDWDFFIKNNERLIDNMYTPNRGTEEPTEEEEYYEAKKLKWATLSKFTEDEFEESWKKYEKSFNLRGEISEGVKEICKQPLMLRFLCEGYEGEEVPTDIHRLQIFDKYWDKKLDGTGASESAKSFLFKIIEEMRELRKLELSKRKVVEKTGETTDKMESIFNRVLDEHIIIYLRKKGKRHIDYVGFTYEAFFEYAMARMIIEVYEWYEDAKNREEILEEFKGFLEESKKYRSMVGTIHFLILLMEDEEDDLHTEMLEYLSKKDSQWRKNVCETISKLSHINEHNERIFNILKELASEDAWQVRRSVADCLGEIRVKKSQLLDLINQWSEYPDAKVRITTAWSLDKVGAKYPKESMEIIAKVFNDQDQNIKKYAKEALLQMLNEIDRINPDDFLLILKDGNRKFRLFVADSIREICTVKPEEALPILRELAGDGGWDVRTAVAGALGTICTVKPEEALPILSELSGDEDRDVRKAVAGALGTICTVKPEEALPILSELSGDEDRDVRKAVAGALGTICTVKPEEALPILSELSGDEDRDVRKAVAGALGTSCTVKPEEALPILRELTGDENWDVRKAVAGALGTICTVKPEEALPILSELTGDENWDVRKAVAGALGTIGTVKPEEALPILRELTGDENWDVRRYAIDALGTIGAVKPEEALPILRELAGYGGWDVRKAVAGALGMIGTVKPEEALPILSELAGDEFQHVRKAVADALGTIGTVKPEEVLPILRELAGDENWDIRRYAIDALQKIATAKPGEALPLLRELAENENWDIRTAVACALEKIATAKPGEALPLLRELEGDENQYAKRVVADALEKICTTKPEEALPILRELVRGKDWDVRRAVADALEKIGTVKPEKTLLILREWVKDEDQDVRWAVADALKKIGTVKPGETLPILRELRGDKDWNVRRAVAGALEKIGTVKPEEALLILKELAGDKDSYVRMAVVDALEMIGTVKPYETFPILNEMVRDEDDYVRQTVADALGKIGTVKPEKALSLLKELAGDKDRDVRKAVADAFKRIGAHKPEETLQMLREMAGDEDMEVRQSAESILPTL